MNIKDQIIALAEIAGWQPGEWSGDCYRGHGWLTPGRTQEDALAKGRLVAWFWHDLPDYLHNLNEVRNVELCLTEEQQGTYTMHLSKMLSGFPVTYMTWKATAKQRCEAILRTCGKWVENAA